MESSEEVGFDSDGSTLIFDNYSNTHILPYEEIFTLSNVVATIGRIYLIPKGI